MVSVVIHSNPHLPNQIESAGWLKQGFDRHGLDCEITADKHAPGDIHVIQGPWYAYQEWISKPDNVLWLNRCFFGSGRFDLSIGWLRPDGTRDFRHTDKSEPNGVLPELRPLKPQQQSAVVFGDYGREVQARHWLVDARETYAPVYMKYHPASSETYNFTLKLEEAWQRCDVAIGGQSTVLVEAAIQGLHVFSHDPDHVVQGMTDRQDWLTKLSWCQWSSEQLINGDFWDHLS